MAANEVVEPTRHLFCVQFAPTKLDDKLNLQSDANHIRCSIVRWLTSYASLSTTEVQKTATTENRTTTDNLMGSV